MRSFAPPVSNSTWRQAPHGDTGSGVSATTASAVIGRRAAPQAWAANTAVRSAQFVRP
jgi:hypothetical protein